MGEKSQHGTKHQVSDINRFELKTDTCLIIFVEDLIFLEVGIMHNNKTAKKKKKNMGENGVR